MAEEKKKSWFARHKILTGLLAVIVFIALASAMGGGDDDVAKVEDSTNDSASAQDKTVFKPGETIAFDGKNVTVSEVERNWNSGNQFITPESNNEFVKVNVTIQNNSSNEVPYNTFDWKIQNSDGVIKDVSSATFTADGALDSGNLAPNGKVSGILIFEVPNADDDLTVRYNPSFWSNKNIEIKLQ